MKRMIGLACCAAGLAASLSFAQEPPDRPPRERGPGAPGGPGGDRARPVMPLLQVLDANSDGTIDEKEIANATAALKKLDKNSDGKLTADELRPPRRERPPGENPDRPKRNDQ